MSKNNLFCTLCTYEQGTGKFKQILLRLKGLKGNFAKKKKNLSVWPEDNAGALMFQARPAA